MLDRISLLLVIVGALNWGSIGLFRFDLVSWICGGQDSIFARIIYTLVAGGNLVHFPALPSERKRIFGQYLTKQKSAPASRDFSCDQRRFFY